MSIRRFALKLPMLVLVLVLLAGIFTGGAAFAEGGGDPLALRFVCDETVASVTVYDPAGLPLPVGADGIHHLTPGTYFYSATAEGYESTGLQAFTIPADAAGDQELRISLTPVPGSVPTGAAPGETPSDASVPGQTPVNASDPNALKENPEDDGKLRIRPVDGSLTLTIERETRAESAVPPELQKLLEGKQKPLQTADGKPVEKKLWLKTPDAEELYLDRLAVEKEIGYYTTDWTVLNLTDEEGSRKNLVPASGWYDVTVSGPATEPYRAYEPVFALVTLHWDEEGDIVDRDVQILETTHTPTKSSWSFSTDTLSTLVIAVPTDRPVESEEAAAKKDRPAFAASSTVDGVTVTVSAPAGVFPADAALWVQRVPLTEEIDAAVEAERDEQKTVAVSYTFDIRVVNPETMEEYQPEEGQSVSVSFALAEVADENLETRVYHVTEEESTGALTAEALDVSESGLTATAETDGFSYYQVEFTYEKLEYVLPGDTSVPLAEILMELGLSGDVTEVSCSNANLFSCDWTENRWVVTAHRAFSSTEWMKVTLNSVVYEITVTDEQYGDWEFDWIGNSRAVITKYNGTGGDVVIPDRLEDIDGNRLIVVSIGNNAFSYCDSLTSITIPVSVTDIYNSAFFNCRNLESVTFAEGSTLVVIEANAFSDCANLTNVTIPASVENIEANAFSDCANLTNVTIPSSVTSIGEEAFGGCDSLNDIWYHGTEAQWNAISSNIGLWSDPTVHYVLSITAASDPAEGGTVTISPNPDGDLPGTYKPDTLVTVTATANSNYAFVNWTWIEGTETKTSTENPFTFTATTDRDLVANFAQAQIVASGNCGPNLTWTLDNNGTLTISGTGAMYITAHWDDQEKNIRKVVINNGATNIGNQAFFDCSNLGSVEIPASVTSIGNQAFSVCSSLVSVTFAPGSQLASIGNYAFTGCDSLTSIEIPSGVTSIGELAFGACGSLSEITVDSWEAHITNLGVDWNGFIPVNWLWAKVTATANPDAGGSVSVTGGTAAEDGYVFKKSDKTSCTVKATVNSGYAFDKWTENGSVVMGTDGNPVGATYSFTVIDDRDLVANFVQTATATLQVTKEFNDWGKADSFTFNLAAVTEGAPMPVYTTAVATEDKPTAVFDTVTYDTAETYEYTITEVNDGADGVTYDTTPHAVVVTVTKDNNTNALSAAVKYDGADELIVTNTFASTTAALQVTKDFEDWSKAPQGFTFELAAVTENAPMPVNTTATATEQNKTATFDEIAYDAAGEYKYTITEVNDGADGVTYDTTPHEVVVTVTKDNNTNALSAAVKYDGDKDSLTVTNTFTPAKATLQVTKEFNDWGKADSFTFNLAAVTANAPMPVNTTATATEQNKTATFGEVTYETAGHYEYTITEVNGGADGVTYDTTPHEVVVTVTKDNNTNALSATVKYDGQDSLTITNTFASTTAALQVTKDFEDWSKAPQGFIFELAAVTENAPMPANNTTATATEQNTTATFDEITYDKAGTYKYTITERNGGADGVTYDTTPHEVVVTVSKNATTNELSATVAYDGAASLTVTNTFTPATAKLEVTKSLNSWRAGDSFTFTLAPKGNAPMPAKDTATATEQNTTATFDAITYETAGRYEYTITEVNGGKPGVTYDTKPHNVVVTVTKAEDATNELSATVAYDEAAGLTVKNTRQFYDVDTSMTGGTVTASPASAAAGDTVTLTVTPDKGSELTSLTVTATGVAVTVNPDQNDPNLYSFVMPATGVTVTATFEKILYTVVEGADSSWLKGSNGDLSIRVKRDPKDETCFQHFRNGGTVAIDGTVLSEDSSALIQKDYKAEEGSTVITLHEKMLNRLSAGKHTVTITFDDGSVSTGLTILVPAGGYSPGTGDSSRIGFWAALMLLAGLGFAGADYARRRLRRPRYVGKHM